MTLSGSSGATTTADSSGNYTFNSVLAGTYSVTPTKPGVIFVPGTQNVSVSGSNVTGVNFVVPQICPCNTIWTSSALPASPDSGDPSSYELGVKFRADSDGYILGVRFYKAATNTGAHIGNLWSSTGSLISTSSFASESASGWQQTVFANPVPVSANTTYVASYFAPAGHYSVDSAFFASQGIDSPPLHALANGVDGPNGVFSASSTSVFPSTTYNANNYWVDVIYATTTTHSLGGIIAGPGAAGATIAAEWSRDCNDHGRYDRAL